MLLNFAPWWQPFPVSAVPGVSRARCHAEVLSTVVATVPGVSRARCHAEVLSTAAAARPGVRRRYGPPPGQGIARPPRVMLEAPAWADAHERRTHLLNGLLGNSSTARSLGSSTRDSDDGVSPHHQRELTPTWP